MVKRTDAQKKEHRLYMRAYRARDGDPQVRERAYQSRRARAKTILVARHEQEFWEICRELEDSGEEA